MPYSDSQIKSHKIFNGLFGGKSGKIENYVSAAPDSWIGRRYVDPISFLQSFINTEADGKKIPVPVDFVPSHGIMDIVNALKPDK
ncbi:MAG: hypothetical protein K2K05_07540 [Muribaculaceae bacterium]|nr:hypothetical protein [Muribaculaceae bacterium]